MRIEESCVFFSKWKAAFKAQAFPPVKPHNAFQSLGPLGYVMKRAAAVRVCPHPPLPPVY